MKKISTSILTCLALVTAMQAQTSFKDDFESYTVGNLIGANSPVWRTWSGQVAAEDVAVVNTDNHTVGGSKSLFLSSTSTTGGPQDLVLPFGGVQDSGIFTFSSWFKVPTGKTGYFNFQGVATIGTSYSLDCNMDANGTLRFLNGTVVKLSTTYPQAAWFELKIVANLTLNNWEVFVNGVSQGTFVSVVNTVSYVDFYPSDANAQYWIDDVQYSIAASFNDDFEGYMVGDLVGATSPIWRTWTGQVAAEDVAVVNTDNHTVGGSKSLYLSSTATGGGPQDLVLPFGGVQDSGIFTFSSWFKVPTGKTGYFNFQGVATIGTSYSLDCNMDANGTLRFLNGNVVKLSTTYPQAAWFKLEIVANLTMNNWEVFVNGVSQGSFVSVINTVAYADFYPADANAQFWVDDVQYSIAQSPLIPSNISKVNINSISKVALFPNPVQNSTMLSLNLDQKSNVELSVSQMNGKVLASKNYGQLGGDIKLPLDVSQYNSGIYFVDVKINGKSNIIKLVKE
jgi:hypothetical protein